MISFAWLGPHLAGLVGWLGLSVALTANAPLGPAVIPVTPAFVVNSYTPGSQYRPAIAARPDHGFVVVWASSNGANCPEDAFLPCPEHGIFGRRFDKKGQALGDAFQVNSSGWQYYYFPLNTDVARAQDGTFVVTWLKAYPTPALPCCFGQLFIRPFDTAGTPRSTEVKVAGVATAPAIAQSESGEFLVAWVGGYYEGIHARRFDSDGLPTSPFITVATASYLHLANAPDVAFQPKDDFVVVWDVGTGYFPPSNGPTSIRGRRFDPGGTPLGGMIEVTPEDGIAFKKHPALAVQEDGSFLVVWHVHTTTPLESHLFARRFAVDGSPLGPEVRVDPGPESAVLPGQVVTLDDGGFFVTWPIYRADGTRAIVGRRLSPAGVPTAGVIELLADVSINQSPAALAHNGHGDLLVAATFDEEGAPWFDQPDIVGRLFQTADLFRDGFESGTFQAWSVVVP
jgi:hypothetical protein